VGREEGIDRESGRVREKRREKGSTKRIWKRGDKRVGRAEEQEVRTTLFMEPLDIL
jgi:hypothetical protein